MRLPTYFSEQVGAIMLANSGGLSVLKTFLYKDIVCLHDLGRHKLTLLCCQMAENILAPLQSMLTSSAVAPC